MINNACQHFAYIYTYVHARVVLMSQARQKEIHTLINRARVKEGGLDEGSTLLQNMIFSSLSTPHAHTHTNIVHMARKSLKPLCTDTTELPQCTPFHPVEPGSYVHNCSMCDCMCVHTYVCMCTEAMILYHMWGTLSLETG